MAEQEFHKRSTMPGLPAEAEMLTPEKVPKKIGPYPIESLLEKGGMSLLYLASHPETKEPITIKVLSSKYSQEAEVVQRLLKEAEIIALADHPNIVKLYGQGSWEKGLYIAMEFVQGTSLKKIIQHQPMSIKRALEVVLEISYALCHLHTHGVIHRDLKPENVLFTESGHIKVIDFGIAQLLSEKDPDDERKAQVIGTPIYMSPEQREDPESVSFPSDIYSLGIITYELVLGRLSHGQIHLSLMPKGLQKILSKALQPNMEDRYKDVVDFISDINHYLSSAKLVREQKGSDQLTEIAESLQKASETLLPKTVPDWEEVELGVIHHKGLSISGIYYDFFPLPEGRYGIVMAESEKGGVEGTLDISMLRGIVRALTHEIKEPKQLTALINEILLQDHMEQIFAFNYLILDPKENKLHFLSSGWGNLWILPEGGEVPERIHSTNPALGSTAKEEWEEETVEWNVGDTLILKLFAPISHEEARESFSSEQFLQSIQANQSRDPQKMAEGILRKVSTTWGKELDEHSLGLLCINRKH